MVWRTVNNWIIGKMGRWEVERECCDISEKKRGGEGFEQCIEYYLYLLYLRVPGVERVLSGWV